MVGASPIARSLRVGIIGLELIHFLPEFEGGYEVTTAQRENPSDICAIHALWIYRADVLYNHFHIGETAKVQI